MIDGASSFTRLRENGFSFLILHFRMHVATVISWNHPSSCVLLVPSLNLFLLPFYGLSLSTDTSAVTETSVKRWLLGAASVFRPSFTYYSLPILYSAFIVLFSGRSIRGSNAALSHVDFTNAVEILEIRSIPDIFEHPLFRALTSYSLKFDAK